jgi:hypothetical protein
MADTTDAHTWIYYPFLDSYTCANCPKVFTREMALCLWGNAHDFGSLSQATLNGYAEHVTLDD